MDDAPMLTTADLAARLNVSTEMVYRMCRTHRWPHARIGRLYRFTEEHYQAIIATPEPPAPWTKERRDNIARMLRKLSE
ncbi:excisionase family DNA binding protein [Arthrobacter pascens]|uniref:helix-turn-helix domain-containing protein n=1 Tax=Arthrobacter pascens TaxID=1677 RepID=UPI0027951EC8|nr:helix-turn-helix domain-containing protein [Arthrobacter pascens]MDQ0679110.1 excisionase family DNA binding protein [Arthrobacter pascens]